MDRAKLFTPIATKALSSASNGIVLANGLDAFCGSRKTMIRFTNMQSRPFLYVVLEKTKHPFVQDNLSGVRVVGDAAFARMTSTSILMSVRDGNAEIPIVESYFTHLATLQSAKDAQNKANAGVQMGPRYTIIKPTKCSNTFYTSKESSK